MKAGCRILDLVDIAFPPGVPATLTGPLARFLPPLEEGAVRRALEGFGAAGDLVLDPFGASPRLVIEAALAGRAMLVAANNPINRFVLEHMAAPFPLSVLQAALARLASAPKDDTRLEPFLLDLYRSECARCGGKVIVDYFVWEREAEGPALKAYACEHCNHAGEDPTTEADWSRAQAYAGRGLQHARALEQVAPSGDPERSHAEAALAVYPGRSLYALITAVSKLEQLRLEGPLRPAAEALLLSAFDAANALWGHPEGRARPLQLTASPRFREANVWRALERAVGEWAVEPSSVEVRVWPADGLPGPGQAAVYPGPAREMVEVLPARAVRALLTVLPRPNQAYWTLSALWAAWLWGREAAAPIKVALRRRRYDWAWHASALRTALAGVTSVLLPGTPVLGLMPEAEAGFIAAALAGLDGAGFRLHGRAVRAPEGQAVLTWTLEPTPSRQPEVDVRPRMAEAGARALRRRGEPAPYLIVHAAAWSELANQRLLAPLWQGEDGNPLLSLGDAFGEALGDRNTFVRLGAGTEPEHGLYWLTDPAEAEAPLAERVERLVLEALRGSPVVEETEVEARVCAALPGLLTPDRRLIQTCLRSYAEQEPGTRRWRLRPEDESQARSLDCEEITGLMKALGERLGFAVEAGEQIVWKDPSGRVAYAFRVDELAAVGMLLRDPGGVPLVHVLPGGRASLVAETARRDPRLRDWLATRGRVLKFRHVRRLAAETTLRVENLAERLALDPPEHRDPQLPLL
ncbi:MAG: hypothetical protein AB1449_07625 [Chloroflexota bacterium]